LLLLPETIIPGCRPFCTGSVEDDHLNVSHIDRVIIIGPGKFIVIKTKGVCLGLGFAPFMGAVIVLEDRRHLDEEVRITESESEDVTHLEVTESGQHGGLRVCVLDLHFASFLLKPSYQVAARVARVHSGSIAAAC
jgi:hypothetical protein